MWSSTPATWSTSSRGTASRPFDDAASQHVGRRGRPEFQGAGLEPRSLPVGEKKPIGNAWQKQRLTADHIPSNFKEGCHNVGVLLGIPSVNLVDIDLDVPEAGRLADSFLPATDFVFGRKSNPRSHRFYRTTASWKSKQFRAPAPDGTMLVELRSTGLQTVVPPSTHPSGERIEFERDGNPVEIAGEDLERAVSLLAAASLLARVWPNQGSRHQAALALAGGLLRAGWTVEETTRFVRAVAEAAGDEEVEDRVEAVISTNNRLEEGGDATGWPQFIEVVGKATVATVMKWLGIRIRTQSVVARQEGEQGSEGLTDYGNAQRLVRRHGKDLLYVHGRGWSVWDGSRYVPDDSGEVVRRAKDTVKAMAAEAAALDDHERIPLLKHALASESASRIKAMISLAESEASVSVTLGQLDGDSFLLNVMNGTIDLRTGELRPHRREDLLTKLAPVEYDADATCPEWESFLVTATGGDREFEAYLRRGVGYCLTGDTSEEKSFFVHGPGATGKTTFAEAVKAMLGDYAMTADFETFLARPNPNGARNDIARLQGARLVTASEVDDDRQFAHSLLKQMTGRDKVAARYLYREFFEFVPRVQDSPSRESRAPRPG